MGDSFYGRKLALGEYKGVKCKVVLEHVGDNRIRRAPSGKTDRLKGRASPQHAFGITQGGRADLTSKVKRFDGQAPHKHHVCVCDIGEVKSRQIEGIAPGKVCKPPGSRDRGNTTARNDALDLAGARVPRALTYIFVGVVVKACPLVGDRLARDGATAALDGQRAVGIENRPDIQAVPLGIESEVCFHGQAEVVCLGAGGIGVPTHKQAIV